MSFRGKKFLAVAENVPSRAEIVRKIQSYNVQKVLAGFKQLEAGGPGFVEMLNVAEIVAMKLGHQDPEIVAGALSVLGYAGHKGAKMEEYMAPLITSGADAKVRAAAVEALGHLGSYLKTPSALAAGLEDSEALVRLKTCEAILEIEDTTKHEAVFNLLKDPSPEVQGAALRTLGGFVGFSAEMESVYKEKLSSVLVAMLGAGRTRDSALSAICDMGDKAPSACAGAVVDALSDKDSTTRMAAVAAVAAMDEAVVTSKGTLSKIKDLLTSGSTGVKAAAASALAALGPKASSCAEAVAELLKEDSEDQSGESLVMGNGGRRLPPQMRRPKAAAVCALGKMASETFFPKIATMLADPSWEVRLSAAEALGGLESKAKGQVSALLTALEDETFPVRAMVCYALGQIKDSEAAPRLVEAFEDSAFSVRLNAVRALGEMGEAGEEFSHDVWKLTNDQVSEVKSAAIKVLAKMGEKSEGYAGVVATMLMDDDPAVREAACETLPLMGLTGAACKEEIEYLLDDPVPSVKMAACGALENMGYLQSPFLKDFGKGPGVPNDVVPYWKSTDTPVLLPGEINFKGLGIHFNDIMSMRSDLQASGKWVEGVL